MKKTILKTILLLSSLLPFNNVKSQTTEQEPKLTYENLYEQIKKYNIKFPDVVFAQAVLETGHFTSYLFRSANNLFGMKKPSVRETLALKDKNAKGFAVFSDWTMSVNDYLLWQEHVLKNNKIQTKQQYLTLLDRIYAEDKKYVILLNKVISDYKHILN